MVVQVADKFADSVVRDGAESGRLEAGRREIGDELAEVFAVVGNGVRRGILHGAKIFEIFGDSCFHFVPGTRLLFRY